MEKCGIVRYRETTTNMELREVYTDLGRATFMKYNKLAWVGRVVRMDQEKVVKKIFDSKQEGR
jgi:TATA-box binding protein (TBP) (component of TFIID and TFIIIB)